MRFVSISDARNDFTLMRCKKKERLLAVVRIVSCKDDWYVFKGGSVVYSTERARGAGHLQ